MFKHKVTKDTKIIKGTYETLDALMVRMASDETYDEYIMLRGKMEAR